MDDAKIDALGAQNFSYAKARVISRSMKLPQFVANCETHGRTRHNTKTGRCVECFPNAPVGRPASDSPRAIARRTGEPTYEDYCGIHVMTTFSTAHGKCLQCFTTAGASRFREKGAGGRPLQADNDRAAARRAGSTVFVGDCAEHGKTPHSVRHGGCLTCFNAFGTPRRRPA